MPVTSTDSERRLYPVPSYLSWWERERGPGSPQPSTWLFAVLSAHVMSRAPTGTVFPGRVGFTLPQAAPGAEEVECGVSKGT